MSQSAIVLDICCLLTHDHRLSMMNTAQHSMSSLSSIPNHLQNLSPTQHPYISVQAAITQAQPATPKDTTPGLLEEDVCFS